MYTPKLKNTQPTEFVLNEFTRGFAQCIDNNWTYAVFAQDPNVSIYQNEYNAGYVQGKVQTGGCITATRNNTWRWYVLDEGPGADSVTPPPGMAEKVQEALISNWNFMIEQSAKNADDLKWQNITRLMYRMLGIYHGAADIAPIKNISLDNLKFSSMKPEDQVLHVEEGPLSFLDVYFINAQMDIWDVLSKEIKEAFEDKFKKEKPEEAAKVVHDDCHDLKIKLGHCSGFVKRLENGELLWTHTSWCCLMAQSCAITYCIGDDFLTQNAFSQGQFGSNTDFGFNGHGIGFNETTETYFYIESKIDGIFMTWRAAAAESFARSIEEFYEYISMDNTGSYLNAYMVVDAYKNKMAMIDMSWKRFAFFEIEDGKVNVTDSTGYEPNFLDWDNHMVAPTHILGCNVPSYKRIQRELMFIDGAPKRRYQLYRSIANVSDIDSAKELITYNENLEPISIAGRWDLNYGTSEFLRYQPHGAIDAKVFGTAEIREVLANLSKQPDINGEKTSFWMKYGSPYIDGTPFIWSTSKWAKFKQPEEIDYIPDAIDGRWNRVKMFMK